MLIQIVPRLQVVQHMDFIGWMDSVGKHTIQSGPTVSTCHMGIDAALWRSGLTKAGTKSDSTWSTKEFLKLPGRR